jgi:hypothetical protein
VKGKFWLSGAAAVAIALAASPANAVEFTRRLETGDEGGDVRALQVRIAGWYPRRDQTLFTIDGDFGRSTKEALVAFQKFYELSADGTAGDDVYEVLDRLQSADGSTLHFDFAEFVQHRNPACSAKANAYAGTFGGGMASSRRVRTNVRRLMWRLEALRAKAGGHPIGINSGFRSVAYNDCIGGASSSQHLYGTAADNRVAEISNRQARYVAKGSQFHGVGCYARLTHNHFDLRIDNQKLPGAQFWWWPERDSSENDLDETGRPCWGEISATKNLTAISVSRFATAGETGDLGGLD